jgi:hypothetical protein
LLTALNADGGDAFYVAGETGNAATAALVLAGGAAVNISTGNIANVIRSSTTTLVLNDEILNGNLIADSTSLFTVTLLNGTELKGIAWRASVIFDTRCVWTLTGNSSLNALSDADAISGLTVTKIIGNGHNIHCDSTLSGNHFWEA